MKRISIIVPVYNAEKTLERCVRSILVQTMRELQIILIDDGSEDDSYKIMERLKKKDRRIEIYHTENRGSVAARKLGLGAAKGELIGFVDADDYIEPEMFFELSEALLRSDADFVHSGHIMEEPGGERVICDFDETAADVENPKSKSEFLRKYILEIDREYISPNIWCKLFKADFIKKCFGRLSDQQQFGEDFICLFRCILESKRIMLYKKAMYHYIINKKSLSHIETDLDTINEVRMWYHILSVLDEYQYLEEIQESVSHFIKKRMLYLILKSRCENKKLPHFYFKDIKQLDGKRVVIFGAGNVGQDYYAQISHHRECHVAGWVDSDCSRCHFDYADVFGLNKMDEILFDVVVIAVNDEKRGEEIKKILMERKIDERKLLWKKPGAYF